ncbi:MAG: TIM-barrel domain-containing protein, partial [Candidatus Heimdallarchaeaceae archaeon]
MIEEIYLEMMSVELLCRAPLWLGKFVVRQIIRRAHTRNNRVQPPKKWDSAALLLDIEHIEESRIKLKLDKGKGYVESIAEGIIRIYTSKENEKEVYSEAIIYSDDNPPKLKLSKGKKIVITQQCSDSIKLILFPHKEIFDVIDSNATKLCSNEYFRTSNEGWYSYKELSGTEDEHYFGFGETTKPLDKRNTTISFWNTDSFAYSTKETHLYQSLPIKIAVRENGYCYAIIHDNPYKSQVMIKNDGKQYLTTYFVEKGGINYYIVLGPSIKKLFERLTKLLGNAPLPPLSALGHHQSRWSYYPEEEVRTLAKEFRKRKIPCDWIHLDIDYMDAYRIFTFDKGRFPNPKKLAEDLEKEGFNLVAITDPGVKVDLSYSVCKEGIDNDHFCRNPDGSLYKGKVWPGECYFPDFSQAKTRKWFGEKFRVLIENGIKGFWIDMNEPSVFSLQGTIE